MLKRTLVLILVILCFANITACKKKHVSSEENKVGQEDISDNAWEEESEEKSADEVLENEKVEKSSEETKTDEKISESAHANENKDHNHDYKVTQEVEGSCTKDGFTEYTCSCGDTYKESTEATGHQWGSWKTVNEKKEGIRVNSRRTCSVCGETEEKTTIELPPI